MMTKMTAMVMVTDARGFRSTTLRTPLRRSPRTTIPNDAWRSGRRRAFEVAENTNDETFGNVVEAE